MNMITSMNNPQIKNIIKLQSKSKDRDEQGLFIIEGIKLFEEAKTQYKQGIVKAYISDVLFAEICEGRAWPENNLNEYFAEMPYKQEFQQNNNGSYFRTKPNSDYFKDIPYEVVTQRIFQETAQTVSPQGILAVMKQSCYKLDDMLMNNQVNILILEDLRDPGNLGTIIRTAEGAGFTGIILSKGCVDIYNPKVIRSTMGSIFRVPFVYADDFLGILKKLKNHNLIILAAHMDGTIDYVNADYTKKNAILIGNEANGISREAARECDIKVRIPMKGKVESLNASVAAALLMYEVARATHHN